MDAGSGPTNEPSKSRSGRRHRNRVSRHRNTQTPEGRSSSGSYRRGDRPVVEALLRLRRRCANPLHVPRPRYHTCYLRTPYTRNHPEIGVMVTGESSEVASGEMRPRPNTNPQRNQAATNRSAQNLGAGNQESDDSVVPNIDTENPPPVKCDLVPNLGEGCSNTQDADPIEQAGPSRSIENIEIVKTTEDSIVNVEDDSETSAVTDYNEVDFVDEESEITTDSDEFESDESDGLIDITEPVGGESLEAVDAYTGPAVEVEYIEQVDAVVAQPAVQVQYTGPAVEVQLMEPGDDADLDGFTEDDDYDDYDDETTMDS